MKNSHRAEEVFKEFPESLKSKIFAAAEGMLVYFPKHRSNQQQIDKERVLIDYAQKRRTYSEIGEELGVSKVRIYQIVNC